MALLRATWCPGPDVADLFPHLSKDPKGRGSRSVSHSLSWLAGLGTEDSLLRLAQPRQVAVCGRGSDGLGGQPHGYCPLSWTGMVGEQRSRRINSERRSLRTPLAPPGLWRELLNSDVQVLATVTFLFRAKFSGWEKTRKSYILNHLLLRIHAQRPYLISNNFISKFTFTATV